MLRVSFFSLIMLLAAPRAWAEPGSEKLAFSRDVLPILSNHCFACHGNDSAARKAGLRLDLREPAIKPARSGETPIVPGQSSRSEVVRRIFSTDADERMPPPRAKKQLSEAEKEIVQRWIDEGAEYTLHWAFRAPVRPALPAVKSHAWVRNDIDAFVLHKLEQASLQPSPAAKRSTIIRRLSQDLRGLPPSVAEVDAFITDNSPSAYEKLVGRMLASPHYGEKMAQLWLDLARFGDTSGFHQDSTRQMWLWRDWVIDAFNKNLPFDQFTIHQLAGDLLPEATVAQKIASGFNRNTRFNEEGGVDPEEFVIRYNIDRTNTLGHVWLGLSLDCAECHDHKYDPITQKEYYQLFAYFNGIREPMVSMNHNQPLPPLLKVPSAEQAKDLERLGKELAAIEAYIEKKLLALDYRDPLEGKDLAGTPARAPQDFVWVDDEPPAGAEQFSQPADTWRWLLEPAEYIYSGKRSMYRKGAGLHQHWFAHAPDFLTVQKGDTFFTYVYLDPEDMPRSLMLQWFDGTWEHRAYWGEDVGLEAGKPNGPAHLSLGPLPVAGKWIRLEVPAEKVGFHPGDRLDGWSFTQVDGTVYWDRAGVNTMFLPDEREQQSLALWAARNRDNPQLPANIQKLLKVDPGKRTALQQQGLRAYFLHKIHAGSRDAFVELDREAEEIRKQIKDVDESVPHTLVSEESKDPPPAHVLLRGDFERRGEKVDRALPAVFPPLPRGASSDRLGLAKWLVRPDHPLTARVVVNRLWGQMFGQAIVANGDFGVEGDVPSHPELLDWLACELVSSGWDVKHVLKLIATSNTYRQSSVFPAELPGVDPHNRLLSRMPRHRLTAEEIRDNALAVSGLLSRRIGGPSVEPYQPADFYQGKFEGWSWSPSSGEDQYRRGLYTFWRRTALHPMLAVFDAPNRGECTLVRPRTNTALQALVTLNDPTFVEAARVFAQRILSEAPRATEDRILFAFRTALARAPTRGEVDILKKHLLVQLDRYRRDPDAASKLVQVGQYPRLATLDVVEHAAWTTLASMLLNLDEAVSRE